MKIISLTPADKTYSELIEAVIKYVRSHIKAEETQNTAPKLFNQTTIGGILVKFDETTFHLDGTEITQEQFEEFTADNKTTFKIGSQSTRAIFGNYAIAPDPDFDSLAVSFINLSGDAYEIHNPKPKEKKNTPTPSVPLTELARLRNENIELKTKINSLNAELTQVKEDLQIEKFWFNKMRDDASEFSGTLCKLLKRPYISTT